LNNEFRIEKQAVFPGCRLASGISSPDPATAYQSDLELMRAGTHRFALNRQGFGPTGGLNTPAAAPEPTRRLILAAFVLNL
jgi:hypothetical protein